MSTIEQDTEPIPIRPTESFEGISGVVPSPFNALQAQTHRESLEVMSQQHRQRLEMWINFTANGLAFCVVGGFFGIVVIALLGFADIRDATVAAFVGTTLGYVVGSIAPISQFYYKAVPMKIEGWIGSGAAYGPPDAAAKAGGTDGTATAQTPRK